MFKPEDKVFFPSTWVEALAFEYAKAHIEEAETPVEFANLFIEAGNQIRDAISKTYSKPQSKD